MRWQRHDRGQLRAGGWAAALPGAAGGAQLRWCGAGRELRLAAAPAARPAQLRTFFIVSCLQPADDELHCGLRQR